MAKLVLVTIFFLLFILPLSFACNSTHPPGGGPKPPKHHPHPPKHHHPRPKPPPPHVHPPSPPHVGPGPVPCPPLPPPAPPPSPPAPGPPITPSPPSPAPPAPPATCPIDALKLNACVDLLGGLIHVGIGEQAKSTCCPLLQGLVDLDAALCLCTTIRAKLLNLKIFLPIALELLITCGKNPPPGFQCPPLRYGVTSVS